MKFATDRAPHWLGADPVAVMMRKVLYALVPVVVVSAWFLGPGIIINLIFAAITCWCLEVIALKMRQRPIQPFASDGSALITACLLALALPPNTAWWVTAVACLFAIVFAGSGAALPDDFSVFSARIAHGTIASLLLILIGLHLAGWIYHQFLLRDGLIRRMWFDPAN